MQMVKDELHNRFSFTDHGRVTNHLGLAYHYDPDADQPELTFSNPSYIDQLLERFRFQDAHPVNTPYAVSARSHPPNPKPSPTNNCIKKQWGH
jgi:hypothetical protein